MTTTEVRPVTACNSRSKVRKKTTLWSVISGAPPIVIGATGGLMLAVEGRIVDVLLVLLLVALHYYAARLLSARYLTIDQTADWTAIRVLTTIVCLTLPFYLAMTMS